MDPSEYSYEEDTKSDIPEDEIISIFKDIDENVIIPDNLINWQERVNKMDPSPIYEQIDWLKEQIKDIQNNYISLYHKIDDKYNKLIEADPNMPFSKRYFIRVNKTEEIENLSFEDNYIRSLQKLFGTFFYKCYDLKKDDTKYGLNKDDKSLPSKVSLYICLNYEYFKYPDYEDSRVGVVDDYLSSNYNSLKYSFMYGIMGAVLGYIVTNRKCDDSSYMLDIDEERRVIKFKVFIENHDENDKNDDNFIELTQDDDSFSQIMYKIRHDIDLFNYRRFDLLMMDIFNDTELGVPESLINWTDRVLELDPSPFYEQIEYLTSLVKDLREEYYAGVKEERMEDNFFSYLLPVFGSFFSKCYNMNESRIISSGVVVLIEITFMKEKEEYSRSYRYERPNDDYNFFCAIMSGALGYKIQCETSFYMLIHHSLEDTVKDIKVNIYENDKKVNFIEEDYDFPLFSYI